MLKLQYWNVRLGEWRDLTDSRYADEASALGAMNFAVQNGMRIEHLRVEPATA